MLAVVALVGGGVEAVVGAALEEGAHRVVLHARLRHLRLELRHPRAAAAARRARAQPAEAQRDHEVDGEDAEVLVAARLPWRRGEEAEVDNEPRNVDEDAERERVEAEARRLEARIERREQV